MLYSKIYNCLQKDDVFIFMKYLALSGEYKKAVLERLYYFAPCGSKESAFLDYLLTVFQVLKVSESKTIRNMDLDLKAL